MKIEMVIKNWHVSKADDGQSPIGGEYEIRCGGKVIASQQFNSGYGSVPFAFSADAIQAARNLDKLIRDEIQSSLKEGEL